MKIQFTKLNILSIIFVSISLSSAVYIPLATLNYLDFYPSLSKLNAEVIRVAYSNTSNSPGFSTSIRVDSPGGYSGFTVDRITLLIFFELANASLSSPNGTLFEESPLSGLNTPKASIPPHSAVIYDIFISLKAQEDASFLDFNRTYSGHILVNTAINVYVLTFLKSVGGYTVLNPVQDLPLS